MGDAPSSVFVGSFNGDAFTDLAVASVGDDNIAIRLGDGAGGFTGTGTVSTGSASDPRSIAVGDFNGDGHGDLVSANFGSSTVAVMLGDGMGAFATDPSPEDVSAGSSLPAANPVAVAVVNTDSHDDSDLDVIIASQTNDQVLFLLGDAAGGFNGRGTTYTAMFSATNPDPSAVAVGSLNPAANSEPDILVANQGGTVPDFLLPGFGILGGSGFQYGPGLFTGTGSDPAGVAFGDLDGDGDQDGISANSGAANATVILSNGAGGTEVDTTTTVGSSPRAVATGSFDADANADAVLANYGSNSVSVLTSLTPGPPPALTPPTPAKPAKKKKCKKPKRKGNKQAAGAKKKKNCKKKRK